MLTKFQRDVLEYFHEYAQAFVEILMADSKATVNLMDDLLPRLVQFLDRTIRLEIGLCGDKSTDYHRLIDMLIEVHIIRRNEQFYHCLCNEMNDAFRVVD